MDVGASIDASMLGEWDRLDWSAAGQGESAQRRTVKAESGGGLGFGVEEAAVCALFGRSTGRAIRFGVHSAGDRRRT